MISRLNRAFWRYCEAMGRCELGASADDDAEDGPWRDLSDAYIADGIRELGRFVARRSRRW